ncbi:hypothetical protein V8E51_018205 [Hyaloscypha variabilis]
MAGVLLTNVGEPPNGPPLGAPVYELVKEDITRIAVGAMVLSTDLDMRQDFMEPLTKGFKARMKWWNSTWGPAGPNAPGAVSATNAWNIANYTGPPAVAARRLRFEACRETEDRAMSLPVPPLLGIPWRTAPISIAFPLLGCRDGYGFANSARQALAAITGWFNDPINGAARRAQIQEVDLVIPLNDAADAGLIEDAWRRAWYVYILGNAPGVATARKPRSRQFREANRLLAEANRFTNPPSGLIKPLLLAQANDFYAAPVGAVGLAGAPTAVQRQRANNRVLRPKNGWYRYQPT